MFGIEGSKDMKGVNKGQRDLESLESEPTSALRKSLAWDSAFFTSPGFLEPEELLHTLNSWDSKNGYDILGNEEHQLLSAKYLEPEIRSVADECNVRKSLAWDSAFFTSEGVLNPEELSLVNKGFKKSEMHMLPGIEELWMSSESNCTIDSDSSSLASLEVDLFVDKTAMHQLSEASSTVASSSRERYKDMQKADSPRKMDGIPKLMVKSWSTSRRKAINGNHPERISKGSCTPPLSQFYAGNGESDPSLPLNSPKILGRGRSIPMAPTKRVSLVANEVNRENKIVRATKGKCLTLKPNPRKTCGYNPISTPSLEFSSLSPPYSMNESKVSCSPYSQFSACRSSLKPSASKNDAPNANPPACNSTLTPPSEYRTTNQITPENCGHPTNPSVTMNCPSTSPSVSGDSCSSMSSTSTDHTCCESMTSANEFHRQFSIDSDASSQSDLERQPHGQTNAAHDGKGSMFPNPCNEERRSYSASFDALRNIKPSGLRLPSPKIGFFNVDDSLVPAESGGWKSHSGVQHVVSKAGACNRNFNENANRSRPGKTQTSQKLKDIRSSMICLQQTRTSPMSGTAKSTFGHAPVSKARSELHCEEKSKACLRNEKMVNVGAREPEFGVESCGRMDKRGESGSMGNKMIKEREEQSCLKSKRLWQKDHNRAKIIYTGNYPLHKNDKENLIGLQNQLEGLRAQVGTLDISGDVVIEFKAKNGHLKSSSYHPFFLHGD